MAGADHLTAQKNDRRPLGLAFAISMSGLVLAAGYVAGYRINTTASMPVGLWRMIPTPAKPARGTIVIACMDAPLTTLALERGYVDPGPCPGGTELLLKPIAAVAGDAVEIGDTGIAVNGKPMPHTAPLARDVAGRELPALSRGEYQVLPNEVWLLSSYSPLSFDSRYFGGVPVSNIRGIARPVWVLR